MLPWESSASSSAVTFPEPFCQCISRLPISVAMTYRSLSATLVIHIGPSALTSSCMTILANIIILPCHLVNRFQKTVPDIANNGFLSFIHDQHICPAILKTIILADYVDTFTCINRCNGGRVFAPFHPHVHPGSICNLGNWQSLGNSDRKSVV